MSETATRDMRDISRCWQNNGYHAHGAGPCFDTYEAVIKYRDEYDRAYAALMEFKQSHPWSWQNCPEWESFNRRWRR